MSKIKISKIKLEWLSAQEIRKISFGEIVSHKLLSSRSLKPELGGLFDPKIFGPFINYQCYCGKYKGAENEGQTCERCGVVLAEKTIQRWRMGHINLAYPVVNVIILKSISSLLNKLVGLGTKKKGKSLECLVYFKNYIVLESGFSKILEKGQFLPKKIGYDLIISIFDEIIENAASANLTEENILESKQFRTELEEIKDSSEFSIFVDSYLDFFKNVWKLLIVTGSEAFSYLVSKINLKEELNKVQDRISLKKGKRRKEDDDLYRFLRNLIKNKIDLNSMVIEALPVIPCGLRPASRIDSESNTVIASQTNMLYKRIGLINQRLIDFKKEIFFEEILNNEKKRLQEAVDRLIFNPSGSIHEGKNSPKSLAQTLSGKEGILRRDSLGKRVDYSARAVIVPDPNLNSGEIGIPIRMALTLFELIIVKKILEVNKSMTVKEAKELIKNEDPRVFVVLNEIIRESYPIIANRAPSLHRLSIQAFYIRLSLNSGYSVRLDPLVTKKFNADFDGDNFNLFLPVTKEEKREAERFLLTTKHTVDPKNGFLIDIPSEEEIYGIYYLSLEKKGNKLRYFSSTEEAKISHHANKLHLHELIVLPFSSVSEKKTKKDQNKQDLLIITTLGKIIFNEILPASFPHYLNFLQDFDLYSDSVNNENERLCDVANVEDFWNKIVIDDNRSWKKSYIINFLNNLVKRVSENEEIVYFLNELKKISFYYATFSGVSISPFELSFFSEEKKVKIEKFYRLIDEVEDYYLQGFYSKKERKKKIINVWESCRDELQKSLIEHLENNKEFSIYHVWKSEAKITEESLTQIFAMRGLATNYFGETIEIPVISSIWEGLKPFETIISVYGVMKGMIELALNTAKSGYFTRKMVEANQNVLVISHDCGTLDFFEFIFNDDYSGGNLVYGSFLASDVIDKNNSLLIKADKLILSEELNILRINKINKIFIRTPFSCITENGLCQKCYGMDLSKPYGELISIGSTVGIIAAQSLGEPCTQLTMRTFKTGGFGESTDIVRGLPRIERILENSKVEKSDEAVIATQEGKIVEINENSIVIFSTALEEEIKIVYKKGVPLIKVGDYVNKGSLLVYGEINLQNYLEIIGRKEFCNYVVSEIDKVYLEQGITIDKKHLHIIVRQMVSKVLIENSGDTEYLVGDMVNYQEIIRVNKKMQNRKKAPANFRILVSSLKDLASKTGSFLSDISFQRTISSLVRDSIECPEDNLTSFKSNLIIGNLLPIGEEYNKKTEDRFFENY